jgi:hypothetical protein
MNKDNRIDISQVDKVLITSYRVDDNPDVLHNAFY